MKNRNGFISNSSSSSFIIKKEVLSEKQIDFIKRHDEIDVYFKYEGNKWDKWYIEEDDDFIKGNVSMDNFDMEQYFLNINISYKDVKWGDFSF